MEDAIRLAACSLHADNALWESLELAPPRLYVGGGLGARADFESHAPAQLFGRLWASQHKQKHEQKVGEEGECRFVDTVSSTGIIRRRLTRRQLAQQMVDELDRAQLKAAGLADIRVSEGGGTLLLTTLSQAAALLEDGLVRCSTCGTAVKSETALWWHRKVAHGETHTEAKEAAAEAAGLALQPYRQQQQQQQLQRLLSPLVPAAPAAPTQTTKKKDDSDLAEGLAAARAGDRGSSMRALVREGKVAPLLDEGLEAARCGDLETLKCLVASGSWDASKVSDKHGSGALLWAAGAGHLEVVKYLIEHGEVDPHTDVQRGRRSYDGRTSLHWAARNGHIEVLSYLVTECGMDVNECTVDGTSAFGWACWKGRRQVVEWLAAHGCDVHSTNQFGCNAVMWAAQGSNSSSSDGDNDVDDDDSYLLEYLHTQHGVSFRPVNSNGHSVLHKAGQRGKLGTVKWLTENAVALGLGPRHMRADNEGFIPSAIARVEGHEAVADCLALLEGSTNGSGDSTIPALKTAAPAPAPAPHTRFPPTTFYSAIATGNMLMLERIMAEDEYYVTQDNGSGPPLAIAASYGQLAMCKHLLKRGAPVGQRDESGMTPLHRAGAFLGSLRARDVVAAAAAIVEEDSEGIDKGDQNPTSSSSSSSGGGQSPGLSEKQRRKLERKAEKAAKRQEYRRNAATGTGGGGHVTRIRGSKSDADVAAEVYSLLLAHGADHQAQDEYGRTPAQLGLWFFSSGSGPGSGGSATSPAGGYSDDNVGGRMSFAEALQLEAAFFATAAVSARARAQTPHLLCGDWWALHEHGVAALAAPYTPPTAQGSDDGGGSDETEMAGDTNEIDERSSKTNVACTPLPPVTSLRDAIVWEEEEEDSSTMDIRREDVAGVPGAFVLRGALTARESASLRAAVDSVQPPAGSDARPRRNRLTSVMALTTGKGGSSGSNTEELYRLRATDPLTLLSATDGIDGRTVPPVEPVGWLVDPNHLAPLCARLRPYLPKEAGIPPSPSDTDSDTFAAQAGLARKGGKQTKPVPLAPPGHELHLWLRCYRYTADTASVPHYDKPARAEVLGTASAYSIVFYLNSGYEGGDTTFFRPCTSSSGGEARSRRGLTLSLGGGAAPLTEVCARVSGGEGDCLIFPHGSGPGRYTALLHEGTTVRGAVPKYLLRTDIMFQQ